MYGKGFNPQYYEAWVEITYFTDDGIKEFLTEFATEGNWPIVVS